MPAPETSAAYFQNALKRSHPNPRVQGGSSPQPLPAQSPPMPPSPQTTPPKTGSDRFLNGAAKIMTKSWGQNLFVWLPAISTDPNTGPTVGLMPVLVIADTVSHHIRQLLAPSYTYNPLFGQTVTGRYYFYPSEASQLYTAASFSQHTNRELKIRYEDTSAEEGVLYLRGEGYYNVDGSARFYGIGPQSHKGDETGYTAKDSVGHATVGINFLKAWRATLGLQVMRFGVGPNIIPDTTDLNDRFSSVPGNGTNNTITNDFHLLWDTRDSPITPTYGSTAELSIEKTDLGLGSNANYFRYGIEGRHLFPWADTRQTTVIHGLFDQANGPNIPFYDLATLGGRTTLRGFGDDRFEDRGRMVLNIEHRYTFASLGLMGIQTNFEVAPFFDLGTVFPAAEDVQRKNFQPVYGAAFRAAVKPNVVGDVEIGIGREGPAVFVDINYPY